MQYVHFKAQSKQDQGGKAEATLTVHKYGQEPNAAANAGIAMNVS
jgi:hypothetical protein